MYIMVRDKGDKMNKICKNSSNKKSRKGAFTLAEALIAMAIIGVVAAITVPTLMSNITERTNSDRQANIALKITKAMELMRAHGELNTRYESTDAFVDELQKYLQIQKRCKAANIADCWPTATVIDGDGEEFEVSKAKKGKNLKHKENETDNVGLVLPDGVSIIMTYNTNAGTIDVGDAVTATKKSLPVGGGKFQDFAYTSSVTGAIDFVMDVNGAKGPNSETVDGKYNDIRSFNGAQFAKGITCDFEIGSLCVKNLGTSYTCISKALYNRYNNCWAGARDACADEDMSLPSLSDLSTIYSHKGEPNVPTSGWFWSFAERNSGRVWLKSFDNGNEEDGYKFNRYEAMCVVTK